MDQREAQETREEQKIACTELLANVAILKAGGPRMSTPELFTTYQLFVDAVGEYLRAEEEVENRHGSE